MRKRRETSAQVELTRADKWRMDEAGVRAGTCSYYVKYLGCVEVYESRGMQVVYQFWGEIHESNYSNYRPSRQN